MNRILLIAVALGGIAFGGAGATLIHKMIQPKIVIPPCPTCPSCPPAVSLLGGSNFEKFNNKKGEFTYSPQINNPTVVLDCSDSVLLKQIAKTIGK